MEGNAVHTYFAKLDEGDFDAAAAAFSEDTVYVRPVAADSSGVRPLEVFRGRQTVLDFFRERGKKYHRHEIRHSVVEGNRCFVEGVVAGEGPAAGQVFVASATLSDDGLIDRYLVVASAVSPTQLASIEETRR
jgi:ketosteroid isomerase-like protein